MCFVWISEQTTIISLYSINWLVFITETECVYCAVRTESLTVIILVKFSLLRVKHRGTTYGRVASITRLTRKLTRLDKTRILHFCWFFSFTLVTLRADYNTNRVTKEPSSEYSEPSLLRQQWQFLHFADALRRAICVRTSVIGDKPISIEKRYIKWWYQDPVDLKKLYWTLQLLLCL
jgi:hypothetical protein